MMNISKKLALKLTKRAENNSLRRLQKSSHLVDFSSNDYLGFAKNEAIFDATHQYLIDNNLKTNGATGSRLLSGNHHLYDDIERFIAKFHQSESALIFNSGYDANIGFFAAVPQRGDVILYDEFCHASIRDGIQLSNAKSYKFSHNNLDELVSLIHRYSELVSESHNEIYVITESVFSMDGDSPNLVQLAEICKKNKAFLIVDEAHAIGIFGENGCGKVQELNLQNLVFARIVTFGKALGCHGAAILGSESLRNYLINFARSFIYTTGLSPHSLATIKTAYEFLDVSSNNKNSSDRPFDCAQGDIDKVKILLQNIKFFKSEIKKNNLSKFFIESDSAIHCCIVSGNERVKSIAKKIQKDGFDVKPVLSPTVTKGKERLRFCLHNYNSEAEISAVLQLLNKQIM